PRRDPGYRRSTDPDGGIGRGPAGAADRLASAGGEPALVGARPAGAGQPQPPAAQSRQPPGAAGTGRLDGGIQPLSGSRGRAIAPAPATVRPRHAAGPGDHPLGAEPPTMNRATLSLPAPAKLNLFLHITGRRADGYHLLQTLFQFLDHGDTLHFTPREDGQIRLLTALPGVAAEDNLILRAARRLQQVSGTRLGADIVLDKRLPMGGGIGGGSSDAATTLVGLDHLWQTDLGEDRLAALGLEQGADGPVCVSRRRRWRGSPCRWSGGGRGAKEAARAR